MKKRITGALLRRRNIVPLLVFVLASAPFPAFGQNGPIDFNVSASVDWVLGEILGEAGYPLAAAGLRVPTGRFMAEEILDDAYPRLLRPVLLSLRVDSGTAVGTLAERGEITPEELDALSRGAEKIPPALSPDLTRISGSYTIYMDGLSALLGRRVRTVEARKPLIPAETVDYTGIVIIADGELPVHGRRAEALAEPCLFPKIWDDDMNLVYDRTVFAPGGAAGNLMVRYILPESVFRPTPSGLDAEIDAFLGPRPLRILAKEVFGINPTDPVIDREDALKILSSEHNRRLLREGRVALALNPKTLKYGGVLPGNREF